LFRRGNAGSRLFDTASTCEWIIDYWQIATKERKRCYTAPWEKILLLPQGLKNKGQSKGG
jgi:hypothetical protein